MENSITTMDNLKKMINKSLFYLDISICLVVFLLGLNVYAENSIDI